MNEYLEIAAKHFDVKQVDIGHTFSYQWDGEVAYFFKQGDSGQWYVTRPESSFTPLYFKNVQEFSYWIDM